MLHRKPDIPLNYVFLNFKDVSYEELHKLLEQPVTHMFAMNKSEALAVLGEIRDALKNSEVLSCVSLDGSQVSHVSTGGYEIKMKCEFDSVSKDAINGVLKRNELYMKEQNGYVIFRSLKD